MSSERLLPYSRASRTALHVGLWSAVLTALVTIVTFALAVTATPISGANCTGNCAQYPYLDTLPQYPRDYRWMFFAAGLVLLYLVLAASIHEYAMPASKVLGQLGLAFTTVCAVVLATTYYVQFSVVPASLINGETEGIAILTQYNPHGLFIALEEFGYLMMAISFAFLAGAFADSGRLEAAIRWTFLGGFVAALIAASAIAIIYGQERLDRLEVALISIDWLVLLIGSSLIAIAFWRQLRAVSD